MGRDKETSGGTPLAPKPKDRDAARVQALFRAVNERISQLSAGDPDLTLELFCECPDLHCLSRVVVTSRELETVRTEGGGFLLAAHHHPDGDGRSRADGGFGT